MDLEAGFLTEARTGVQRPCHHLGHKAGKRSRCTQVGKLAEPAPSARASLCASAQDKQRIRHHAVTAQMDFLVCPAQPLQAKSMFHLVACLVGYFIFKGETLTFLFIFKH